MGHFGTKQRFRHTRIIEGQRHVIWASGEGDLLVPVSSDEYDELIHGQTWKPNFLADEGEADMLDVYFDDQAVRSSLFLRLFNDTVTETDGLSDLVNEVSGTGYSAITVTRGTDWTAPSAGAGTDMATKQFSASGTWSDATVAILSTTSDNTGLLIIANDLAATRSLINGDTLDIDLNVSLE